MGVPRLVSALLTSDLFITVVRSAAELAQARERSTDHSAIEALLDELHGDRRAWALPGVCKVCDEAVAFHVDWQYSDGETINFRERLVCPRCGLNNRQRFMGHLLSSLGEGRQPDAVTFLYEQVTPFFTWASNSLPGRVIGSEYLGPAIRGGTSVGGIRHEDALSLSFGDDMLSSIVSNDVFEHVPDIDRSLDECARVLRPGGRLLFSIPFHETPSTVQRAAVEAGEVVELRPPQYHGNPVDPGGSLVFYDHGWDILERCRAAGFGDAYLLTYWSLLYGYLGGGLQLVFVAEAS